MFDLIRGVCPKVCVCEKLLYSESLTQGGINDMLSAMREVETSALDTVCDPEEVFAIAAIGLDTRTRVCCDEVPPNNMKKYKRKKYIHN